MRLKDCIVIWALAGVGFLMPLTQKIQDSDFWWHIATGRLILQSHTIPDRDPFSFTSLGREWIAHEWLSEVIFYQVYRIGGLGTIILLKSFLILLLTISLYLFIRRRTGDGFVSALAAAFLAMVGVTLWSERPQLFSYLFLISLLRLIDRWRKGGSIWAVVPLFALWINLHGAWLIGFGVLSVVLVEEGILSFRAGKTARIGHLALVYMAAAGALFLNPIGVKLVLYPFQYFGHTYHTQYIREWQSPNWLKLESLPLLLAVIGLPILVYYGRAKTRISEWVFAFGTAAASLFSVRHAPVFAILAAPLIGVQIKALMSRPPRNTRITRESVFFNWMSIAVLMILLFTYFPVDPDPYSHIRKSVYPVNAVEYLWPKEVVGKGRLMCGYSWGGYLIFKLYPSYLVSIDGRADVHGEEAMHANHRLETLKGNWQKDLKDMNPDLILWPGHLPLAEKLKQMPEWKLIYKDQVSVLFIRR